MEFKTGLFACLTSIHENIRKSAIKLRLKTTPRVPEADRERTVTSLIEVRSRCQVA